MLRLLRLWRLTARDLRVLVYALRHARRPVWLLPAAMLLGFYALEPLNFALPMVGIVDDFILVPLALHWLIRLLPADIRTAFAAQSATRWPVRRIG